MIFPRFIMTMDEKVCYVGMSIMHTGKKRC